MTDLQKKQTEHYLNAFIRLANSFFDSNNMPLAEYWKGQVFGICKMITLLNHENDIDPVFYLNQLY